MEHHRTTVAELRENRHARQLTMVHVESLEEARACDEAGIDLLSIEGPIWSAQMREAAGRCFVQVGYPFGMLASTDEHLSAAMDAYRLGADAFYCAASIETIERLAAEGVPVVGHVGLIPSHRTWTGGFKAVGKTAASALAVFDQVRALEAAGAFAAEIEVVPESVAAEIEVVPESVAAEIAKRTSLLLFSMGAGRGCHGQYLFSSDILGYTDGHVPRHAKRYRDFDAELARLQRERVAAFAEFAADVASGAYPAPCHHVVVAEIELADFVDTLEQQS